MLMINITFRIGRPLQAANVIVQVRNCCCFGSLSYMDAQRHVLPLGCVGNTLSDCHSV